MVSLWDQLNESERLILISLHFAGASPRKMPLKAAPILVHSLRRSGRWTEEVEGALVGKKADWPPIADELDNALVGLVQRPRQGQQLIEGWGNYGPPEASSPPCHPLFRDCRLSLTGQRLVLDGLGIVPATIHDEALGTLFWNSSQCWWERKIDLAGRATIELSLYQAIPGSPLDLKATRESFWNICERQEGIRQDTAARALEPETWLFYAKDLEDSSPRSKEELLRNLVLHRIQLDAEGGGEVCFNASNVFTIEAEVNPEGFVEDVAVFSEDDRLG
jgi:hypothetical protein